MLASSAAKKVGDFLFRRLDFKCVRKSFRQTKRFEFPALNFLGDGLRDALDPKASKD